MHEPVMAAEVTELLCRPRAVEFIDATVGTGGHSLALLQHASPAARLLGLDRDRQVLEIATSRLKGFGSHVILRRANFADICAVAREEGFLMADAIVADLGMSSFALEDPARGLSFMREGPLDMRMNQEAGPSAYDLVNEESESELARIIYEFGEERASRRIARAIVEARRKRLIATTTDLRLIIEGTVGGRRRGGIHPATRTFQALRIAVNDEMGALARMLAEAPGLLSPGGRMAIISYHSLEDRQVKLRFRELVQAGDYREISRKVMVAGAEEIKRNPRARSARLRCLERNP